MKTDDTTQKPRRNEKAYYLCNENVSGEQSKFPQLAWRWLERAREGDWLEVFIVVREWSQVQISGVDVVWISHQFQKRDHLSVLSAFPEGERYKWFLKANNSQISKMDSEFFW